jgi:hypothetical protein
LAREKAIQIPLEVWQDPQGDVILNVSETVSVQYILDAGKRILHLLII